MKNVYIFFTIILSVTTLSAQVTANFTTADGYANGALGNNENWVGGGSWFVNTTNEKVSTSANSAEALWTEQLTSISGSTVTFEVNFSFNGDFGHSTNELMAQIGFYNEFWINGGASRRDYIYLSFNTFNGGLKISDRANANFAITTKAVSNWIGSDLTAKVALTIGTTAANSYISVILINNTTNESTDIGTYGNGNGGLSIRDEIFAYAGNGKVRGFFKTITLQDGDAANTEFMGVSSVSLTNGNTLSTKDVFLSEFMLSNNPVGETVEISGVEAGSEINIYTITGAKASNHVYNGSSLNLSHLNTGVYFMETPGFAVKKMLKK
jgi:hypothetical protein